MAIKKKGMNIARVAREASETFVAPKPLATNEDVRNQIAQNTAVQKPTKRVCTIQKVGGFSFFTTEGDREALDFIAFKHKYEKQNIVRTALHEFLAKHYKEAIGLDEVALKMVAEYEESIYKFV